MTNCPNKSIPNAEKRRREASPDVLKASRLVRVSAPTNREERNDRGKREVKTGGGGGAGSSQVKWKPGRGLMSRKIMF